MLALHELKEQQSLQPDSFFIKMGLPEHALGTKEPTGDLRKPSSQSVPGSTDPSVVLVVFPAKASISDLAQGSLSCRQS